MCKGQYCQFKGGVFGIGTSQAQYDEMRHFAMEQALRDGVRSVCKGASGLMRNLWRQL